MNTLLFAALMALCLFAAPLKSAGPAKASPLKTAFDHVRRIVFLLAPPPADEEKAVRRSPQPSVEVHFYHIFQYDIDTFRFL